jgi:hypothetical protein
MINNINKFNERVYYLIILFLTAIFIAPKSLFLEKINLRPEDIVAILLIPYSLISYLKYKKLRTQTHVNIFIIYLIYIFLITIVNDVLFNYQYYSIILFIKEFSFLSIYVLTYSIIQNDKIREKLYSILIILILPNLIYGIYQLMFGWNGIYGVSPFGHEESPLSSGIIYFYSFFISYLYSIKNGKINIISILLLTNSLIMVILSGSKTSVLGLSIFILIELIRTKYKILSKLLFVTVITILLILFIINFNFNDFGSLSRYSSLSKPLQLIIDRGIWWKFQWINDPMILIFGNGMSIGHIDINNKFLFNMAMDNQYLYCLVTLGFLGSTIYMCLLIIIILSFKNKSWSKGLFISLTISYLAMGLGAEIFHLSVSGSLFWFFAGLLLSQSKIKN